MTIMSDIWIEDQCMGPNPLIQPFAPKSISKTDGVKHPSFGSSGFGYDIRIGRHFKIMLPPPVRPLIGPSAALPFEQDHILDSRKSMPPNLWETVENDSLVIQPGQCVLGASIEYLDIPRDILVVCMAKSTFARMFLETTVTPIESGWCGHVTIEMVNKSPRPIRIHAGDGIMQMLFLKGDQPCGVSYADRGGKYQDQPPVPVPPRLL
jgi:dCTP deaminase